MPSKAYSPYRIQTSLRWPPSPTEGRTRPNLNVYTRESSTHSLSPCIVFHRASAERFVCFDERRACACSVQDHAAAAGERDVGNAAAHHAATSRPAGERGIGIASADHADTWRPAGERSQLASLFYKT